MAYSVSEIIADFVRESLFRGSFYLTSSGKFANKADNMKGSIQINLGIFKRDMTLSKDSGKGLVVRRLLRRGILTTGQEDTIILLNPKCVKYFSIGEKSDLINNRQISTFEIGIRTPEGRIIPIIGEFDNGINK
jgi:hypothetical protein